MSNKTLKAPIFSKPFRQNRPNVLNQPNTKKEKNALLPYLYALVFISPMAWATPENQSSLDMSANQTHQLSTTATTATPTTIATPLLALTAKTEESLQDQVSLAKKEAAISTPQVHNTPTEVAPKDPADLELMEAAANESLKNKIHQSNQNNQNNQKTDFDLLKASKSQENSDNTIKAEKVNQQNISHPNAVVPAAVKKNTSNSNSVNLKTAAVLPAPANQNTALIKNEKVEKVEKVENPNINLGAAASSKVTANQEVNDDLPKNTLIYLNRNNLGGRINPQTQANQQIQQTTATLITPRNASNNSFIQLAPKTSLTIHNAPIAKVPLNTTLITPQNDGLLNQGIQGIQAIGDKISTAGQDLIGSIQKVGTGIGQGIGQIGQTSLKIVASATELIGIPYRFGGNTPNTGLDCSGFVRYVYQNTMGLILPRQSAQMSTVGKSISRDDLSIGDLVFFNTRGHAYSHVGIYMGGGRFIHSPSTGKTIRFDQMDNSYWAQRYNGARRLI